jgi:hypothetical protein
MKREELEEIRKRAEATSAKFWMVKCGLGEGAEVNTGNGFGSKNVCVTQYTTDAEFIAHAREDVPKLLAEIERLKGVLSHIDELSDEFFNIEVIDGQPTFTLRPEIEKFRDIIHEIAIVSYEAVKDDD